MVDLTGKVTYTDSMFSKLVKAARLRCNLSQDQLAKEIGVSVKTIRNVESGRTHKPMGIVRRTLLDWIGEVRAAERMEKESL